MKSLTSYNRTTVTKSVVDITNKSIYRKYNNLATFKEKKSFIRRTETTYIINYITIKLSILI